MLGKVDLAAQHVLLELGAITYMVSRPPPPPAFINLTINHGVW